MLGASLKRVYLLENNNPKVNNFEILQGSVEKVDLIMPRKAIGLGICQGGRTIPHVSQLALPWLERALLFAFAPIHQRASR